MNVSTIIHTVLWHCWLGGRKGIWPKKTEWRDGDAGVVTYLGQGADLHMAQLMPLPLTIVCSNKSRLVLPSWYYLSGAGSPGESWTKTKRAVKWLCVCMCECKYKEEKDLRECQQGSECNCSQHWSIQRFQQRQCFVQWLRSILQFNKPTDSYSTQSASQQLLTLALLYRTLARFIFFGLFLPVLILFCVKWYAKP